MKKFIFGIFVAAIFLGMVCSAQAGIDSPFAIDNIPNVFGVGVAMVPDYLGSDDYTAAAAPFFRWTFKGQERYLQLLATELSFNVLNDPNWALGPVLNYRPGRDDVDDNVVDKMQKIDDSADLGIFAGYVWRDSKNPRHRFITNIEFLQDVGDVSHGWTAMAGARYWYPISRPIDVQIGVGTTYGNSNYMNTYFGVNSTDSLKSGLKQYNASSGWRDVNAQLAMVFHFSMNWHVGVGVKYFDLLSEAADSPIVDQRGDASQFVYGLGVAYSW